MVTQRKGSTAPPDDEPERKERVIHTRVPERLEAELRERADALGMSVSNLIRNVLGNAVGLVGEVVADGKAVARAARHDVPARPASSAPAPGGIDDVIGWQPLVLAKNAVCARCNALLPRGSSAGLSADGGRLVVCAACLQELTS
jgi:plasmid stability protein